jgi:hypothetical protein
MANVREHRRPQRDEIRFWIPKEQVWLSLDELSYLMIRKRQRQLGHDDVFLSGKSETGSASGPSEPGEQTLTGQDDFDG